MTASPSPSDAAGSIPTGATALVDRAKQDLATRAGVSQNEIGVSAVTPVDWPDSSLGCPQPGMFYAQVITAGYRIVLTAKGKPYEYHSNRDDRVVFCKEL